MTATQRSAKLQKPEDYDLRKSKETIGSLYPVLIDAEGKVIDGMHRLHVDKDWPIQKLANISGTKTLIARILANVARREVSREEKRKMLKDLAKATKWTPDEIAEHTGMSANWVRKYLDPKHKNAKMSKLASRKHQLTRAEQTSTKSERTCPNCGSRMQLMCCCHDCGEMEEAH